MKKNQLFLLGMLCSIAGVEFIYTAATPQTPITSQIVVPYDVAIINAGSIAFLDRSSSIPPYDVAIINAGSIAFKDIYKPIKASSIKYKVKPIK